MSEERDKEEFWLALKYPAGFRKGCKTCKYHEGRKWESECMIPFSKGNEFSCVMNGYKYWKPNNSVIFE